MEQRLSVLTLGCRDVDRTRAFYEAMGWKAGMVVPDDVCFFQAGGTIFALWQRDKMVADSNVADGQGFAGVTLAYNTRSEAEVDAVIGAGRRRRRGDPEASAARFLGRVDRLLRRPGGVRVGGRP